MGGRSDALDKEGGVPCAFGKQRGSGADSARQLVTKAHSHRPSDQGTTQKKGRLDEAGLLKLLGLEGSLTLTQVKWKGEGTQRETGPQLT